MGIKKFCNTHPCLTVFLFGLTSCMSLAPHFFVPIFWVSLSVAWLLSDKPLTHRKALKIGYFYMFGHFVGSVCGVACGIFDHTWYSYLGGVSATLLLSAFLALLGFLPFIVWHFLVSRSSWLKVLSFASAWALSEWIQTFFSPSNMAGVMFASHPVFLQTASVGGIYLLSFINILFAGGVYMLFKKRFLNGILVLSALLFGMLLFGFYRTETYNFENSNIKIRLVQPNIEKKLDLHPPFLSYVTDEHIKLTLKSEIDDFDFVIWGESALNFKPEYSEYNRKKLQEAIPKNGYLIAGITHYDAPNALYDSFWVLDDQAIRQDFYNKHHLIPYGGEYIPFRKYLPKKFQKMKTFSGDKTDTLRGEKFKTIHLKNYPPFGALICYDVLFTGEVASKQDRPEWLILISNSSWFLHSNQAYHQFAAAQIRAIEEGLTLVQTSKFGTTALVDPTGKIHAQLKLTEKGVLDIYLPKTTSIDTIYSHIGDKPIIVLMFIILLGSVFVSLHSKKQK